MVATRQVSFVLLSTGLAFAAVYGLSQLNADSSPLMRQTVAAQSAKAGQQQPATSVMNMALINPHEQLALLEKGTLAPHFEATDANGDKVALADYLGKEAVVMVFYQGHFCSVCASQLEGIQAKLQAFEALPAKVIAVSADTPEMARATVGEHGLNFPVIPDPQRQLIEQFGVANRAKANIAYPSVYVIGKNGRVQLAFADEAGRRMQADELLKALKRPGQPQHQG